MFTALMTFPAEREVILKERSSGSYHLGAYFLVRLTSMCLTEVVLKYFEDSRCHGDKLSWNQISYRPSRRPKCLLDWYFP